MKKWHDFEKKYTEFFGIFLRRIHGGIIDMSEITISQLYVKTIFRYAVWTDDNKNNKVEPAELRPNKALDDPALKAKKDKILGIIETQYKPLIKQIDVNKDGLSIDEIKSHLSAVKKADINVDLDKAVEHLVNSGRYNVPAQPIIFLMDDKIPKDLMPLLKNQVIELKKRSGAAGNIGISKVNGIFSDQTNVPGDKVSVILVRRERLDQAVRINTMAQFKGDDLMHEIEHAKQYLTGKTDLYMTVLAVMSETAIDNALMRNMQKLKELSIKLYSALLEIEAYNISLKYEISAKNTDYETIYKICHVMNSYLIDINDVKKTFKDEFKQTEYARLFDDLLSNVLSNKEVILFNALLKSVSDKYDAKSAEGGAKGCQIYPNIDQAQFNEIYKDNKFKFDK